MKRIALLLALLLFPGTIAWAVDYYQVPQDYTRIQEDDNNEWIVRKIESIEYVDGIEIKAVFTNGDTATALYEPFKSILTLALRTDFAVFLYTSDLVITGYGIIKFP